MAIQAATDLEKYFADLVNGEREERGLDPLKVEFHLNASAQAHSDWMAENGVLQHSGEDGSTPRERIEAAEFPLTGSWSTAENVAYHSLVGGLDEGEVDAMHQNLMNSQGHRENILRDNVDYIGIALSIGTVRQNEKDYTVAFVTQNFAATDGEVLVQDEIDGEDVAVPYQNGEPTGEPVPVDPTVPTDPDDEEEETPQDPDSGSGGGCFVATAAYGDRRHPDVVALRRFRDETLVKYRAGRAFIRTYWVVGPVMARMTKSGGLTGRVARAVIRPLAAAAKARSR